MNPSAISYEAFLDEAEYRIKRQRKALKGAIVFSDIETWLNIDYHIDIFNFDRKSWNAELLSTKQKDFFILRFFHLVESSEERYFYIKSISETNYLTLLVFTFADSKGTSAFSSFIENTLGLWYAWLGSKFLENFESFLKDFFNVEKSSIIQFSVEHRDTISKWKIGSLRAWIPRKSEDLVKYRDFYLTNNKEVVYIKRGRYRFRYNDKMHVITLTDRAEFTIHSRYFIELFPLINEIIDKTKSVRMNFIRKIGIRKKERIIDKEKTKVEVNNIESVEIIEIDMQKCTNKDWFSHLVSVFSIGFINEHKIMSFILETGNPYFLADVIDIENGGRVFVSAVDKYIRISPSLDETRPETVSKILTILQSRVDPAISSGAV